MHFLYNFSKRKNRLQKEAQMTIRILLVDDHMVVRKGLRTFLALRHPHRPGVARFLRENRVASVECQFIEYVPRLIGG